MSRPKSVRALANTNRQPELRAVPHSCAFERARGTRHPEIPMKWGFRGVTHPRPDIQRGVYGVRVSIGGAESSGKEKKGKEKKRKKKRKELRWRFAERSVPCRFAERSVLPPVIPLPLTFQSCFAVVSFLPLQNFVPAALYHFQKFPWKTENV